MSGWGTERGAHGNVTHRHNTMAQHPTRMPETRPRSRNHHLPTMRRHPRLQRVTTPQQRRGRPHRAPRTRRGRHPREHAHSLQALQPITRRQASIPEADTHIPRMVTRGVPPRNILGSGGRTPEAKATRHPPEPELTQPPPTVSTPAPRPACPPLPIAASLPPHCGRSLGVRLTKTVISLPSSRTSPFPGLS